MTNKQAAIHIIKVLKEHDFQAFLAGGCVRDMLLNRPAKDYDVATNANPKQIKSLFPRRIEVGEKFGVVIVLIDQQQIEVATFRRDKKYVDGRHPSEVEFSYPREDAKRRDFTINGMFYDPVKDEIIDYVNGRRDLRKKTIKTIGNPKERFREDYLRVLRAVRFSTQLDFDIEKETWQAVRKYSTEISKISGERISMELENIICDRNRKKGLELLKDSCLLENIFPGFCSENSDYSRKVLTFLPEDIDYGLGLSGLFSSLETEEALKKLEILKLSNNQIRQITFLLENRGKLLNYDMRLAELKKILAEPFFKDLVNLQMAILKAERKSTEPLKKIQQRKESLKGVELQPKPLVNGNDLKNIGLEPGPEMGHLLEEIYVHQLEGILKDKNEAIKWAKEWLKEHKD